MPLSDRALSKDRLQFYESISNSEIESIISNKDVKTLQTNNPVSETSWNLINDFLLPARPDIEIRIFGHYSDNCDLSILKNIVGRLLDGRFQCQDAGSIRKFRSSVCWNR